MKPSFLTAIFGALAAAWYIILCVVLSGMMNLIFHGEFYAQEGQVQFALIVMLFIEVYKLNRKGRK